MESISQGGCAAMKLLLTGHEERYAIEQLQLSLFPGEQMEPVYGPFQGDGAESILSRGEVYLTATTVIWYRGRKSQCVRRMHLEAETVQLRRRLLQSKLEPTGSSFWSVRTCFLAAVWQVESCEIMVGRRRRKN